MSAFGGAFGQPSSGFGAPSNSAFGAPSSFGQSSQSAFGSSAFGAPSGGLFGASAQKPQSSAFGSFGQSAAPFGSSSVFGASAAQSAPAFGASGAYGSSVFGGQSSSGFGASGAFGASQSAFGSGGGGFGSGGGSSLFGNNAASGGGFGSSGGAFGASQAQSWGTPPNALGASSAFGSSGPGGGGLFGNTGAGSSLFGNQNNPPFAAQNQAQRGTAGSQWQITTEYDSGNPTAASKYQAISMMPAYREKSLEELRFEDYALGNKGGNAPSSGGSLFGQTAPSTGLFGSAPSASAFGSTGGGFGASSSAFGQQSSAFGASSGGGLFGGNAAFGSTGSGFGQSSSSAFGNTGGGFGQSGGGLFGQQSGGGFGGQSSSGFGGASNAFGSSGFGSGSNALGSTGGGFGAGGSGFGSGGGGFGSSGSAFGGNSGFGSGSGFGNSGFGGNNQSGGNTLFGQSGASNAFGAPQSQPSLFGAPAQSGGGLFGSAAPTGGNLFGNTPAASSNLFGGGGQQNNAFGGGAASAPSLFGSNTGGQKPLFGQSAPATGFGAPNSGGLFGNTGTGFGQSAPSTGFGGGFGAPSNQQQNGQASLFGGTGGQVAANVQSQGQNPSLLSTMNAVAQGNGGTVAPPGANYGTVLHNLQVLKSEVEKQKQAMEQQSKANAQNTQQAGSVSIVVLPSPPLVKLSANSASGQYGWTNRTPYRTRMRSAVGRLGGVTNKISGTPMKLLGPAAQSPAANTITPSGSTPTARKMPFFSPQQFSAPRNRLLRSSDITTPHRSSKTLLPVPDSFGSTLREKPGEERKRSSVRARTPSALSPSENPARNGSRDTDKPDIGLGTMNGHARHVGDMDSLGPCDGDLDDGEGQTLNGNVSEGDSETRQGSTVNRTYEAFMWSSRRPSTWSLKRPVGAKEQFDPAEYIPYLARSDFYTVPTIAELASRSMKELQSVAGFTVGRKEYGEVRWIEPVDVRGLHLDSVIDIQRGEIAVYPERDAYQLDAPAVVSLAGMYKKDKKTGARTTDKRLIAKYAERLADFCENNNLRFIDYKPEDGEWKFEVKKFSED